MIPPVSSVTDVIRVWPVHKPDGKNFTSDPQPHERKAPTPWAETKQNHLRRLHAAIEQLSVVSEDQQVWYLVRQSAQRALEQAKEALSQLEQQESPVIPS